MRVFVAGATGAIGRVLVPRLVEAGHTVAGMTRSSAKAELVRELGATPVVADALDPEAVARAVAECSPQAIIHELTAIGNIDVRHFDRSFATTNRLRTEGTDHLLSAARAAGVERFMAQSYAGWPYARVGGPVKDEADPLDPDPPRGMEETLKAIQHVENAVTGASWTQGIVLRYGALYGPGTSLAPGGDQFELIRKRRYPVVGGGAGIWSFVHVHDAAQATLAALERGHRGIYNIVDDDPAAVAEWLPALAMRAGAPKPWRVPGWLGRLAAGDAGLAMMTAVRGASNAKATRELGWRPAHASWRDALGT